MESSFRKGDRGRAVGHIREVLSRLELVRPGAGRAGEPAYDDEMELAVRTFQQQRGLSIDGVVGPATYRRLDEARWRLGDRILTYRPGNPTAGDDVFALQQRLLELGFDTGRVDGYFGAGTEAALREFQHDVGLPADGTCGPATLKTLAGLRPRAQGGAPDALRAQEHIREAGPRLAGKTIVVDPGLGHQVPVERYAESDALVHDLARRVEGRLVAIGVQAFLSRPASADRPATSHGDAAAEEERRAGFANRAGADLCVTPALDWSPSPGASGVATYYFGSESHGTSSAAGERLAGLAQREIVARTDLVDLRTHTKAWDLLRRTRMPAVVVEPGYLSHPRDRERLEDPGFRDVVAEAIVVAIQRFYLSPEVDEGTGTLHLDQLTGLGAHGAGS
ncbi:MAG: peptidoglycan-binding protein [Marmoricola sp.]